RIGPRFEPNAMGRDWPGYVLDLLVAHVLERKIELIAHLIAHDAADADPAWLRQSLQTRSDIDAVAVNILVVDDDVTDVETDAKLDTLFRRDLGVALGDLPLDVDRAAYRIDDARKLDEDAVARGLDDAPAVLRDFWIDDRASVALECGQRAFLIHAHQPRIACNIPGENGREAAFDSFSAQGALLKAAGTSWASCSWTQSAPAGRADQPARASQSD